MKHTIKANQKIDLHQSIVKVELLPDNDAEKTAIKNVETMAASDNERELVENYLHFSLALGNYSVVKLISLEGNNVTLQIFV